MNFSRQMDFDVKVGDVDGFWAQMEGAETAAETSEVIDGGDDEPVTLAGIPRTSNITLTRPYSARRDQKMINQLMRRGVGSWRTRIVKQPRDEDGTRIGSPTVYPRSLLVKVTPPPVNKASAEGSMVVLEFATSGPAK